MMSGYVPLRRGILEHLEQGRLSAAEFAAYVAMILRADKQSGVWWGSAKALAATMGITERGGRHALEQLEHKGYIKRFATPRSHRNYPILIDKYAVTQGARKGLRLDAARSSDWRRPVYLQAPCVCDNWGFPLDPALRDEVRYADSGGVHRTPHTGVHRDRRPDRDANPDGIPTESGQVGANPIPQADDGAEQRTVSFSPACSYSSRGAEHGAETGAQQGAVAGPEHGAATAPIQDKRHEKTGDPAKREQWTANRQLWTENCPPSKEAQGSRQRVVPRPAVISRRPGIPDGSPGPRERREGSEHRAGSGFRTPLRFQESGGPGSPGPHTGPESANRTGTQTPRASPPSRFAGSPSRTAGREGRYSPLRSAPAPIPSGREAAVAAELRVGRAPELRGRVKPEALERIRRREAQKRMAPPP